MLKNKIKNDGFLKITLMNEWHLEPFSFSLGNKTKVEIWDTGVIAFMPPEPGNCNKDIILSCGVHGNETAPIEMLAEFVRQLIAEEYSATSRILFIFANPAAMNIRKRFVDENMNRLFSGAYADKPVINKERDRAAKLEMYITRFFGQGGRLGKRQRIHYDLHATIRDAKYKKFVVCPFIHEKKTPESQLKFIASCGISAILFFNKPTTTFSYFSANNFNASAFTFELGRVHPFGKNDPDDLIQARQSLHKLITGQNIKEVSLKSIDFFKVHKNINRMHENFSFTFADDIVNFTSFNAGEVLGYNDGLAFTADFDGEAILFPNNKVAIGQRALLTIIPCTPR